jgi:hypothetical protein
MRRFSPRGSIASVITLSVLTFILSVLNTPALQAQNRPDLEALNQRLLPLFELDGLVYTDADERTGRLVVGVVNAGLETSVRARLDRLGVSSQLVDVVVTAPIVQVATPTLTDFIRPIEGGLQTRWDNYICTIGFNGVRAGVQGFVMASHCTTKQGGVNGTKYYQPINKTAAEFIGTEIADPSYQRGITGCPVGRVCRYSDSAFAQRASGVTASMGYIAKTDGVNTGSLTLDGTQFRIVSEGASQVGDTLNKVGRTTGWTQGVVTQTCVNTGVQGTNIVQICQDFVAAGVGGGDSSAPVFAITSGNDVELRGILWGSGGGVFVYSPIGNVEAELGSISTCYNGGC